eukprot:2225388-Karenia_brevis.AAC.1
MTKERERLLRSTQRKMLRMIAKVGRRIDNLTSETSADCGDEDAEESSSSEDNSSETSSNVETE